MTAGGESGVATRVLRRAVDVRAGETRALLGSCAYFFSLLCGYYLLRPLREEMGIRGGVGKLHWVFSATFVATVVGPAMAHSPDAAKIPVTERHIAPMI